MVLCCLESFSYCHFVFSIPVDYILAFKKATATVNSDAYSTKIKSFRLSYKELTVLCRCFEKSNVMVLCGQFARTCLTTF